MSERMGDWVRTVSGREFYFEDPLLEDIYFEDIARGLSNICRFGGQVPRFYSVAQHSCLVAYLLPKELKLWGMLHDAAEAYVGDMVRPLKYHHGMVEYRAIERLIMSAIADHFELSWPMPQEVKVADTQALLAEQQYLLGMHADQRIMGLAHVGPLEDLLYPMDPSSAYHHYVRTFNTILKGG